MDLTGPDANLLRCFPLAPTDHQIDCVHTPLKC